MVNECVIDSLMHYLDSDRDGLKEELEYGKHKLPNGSVFPPSIHKVIDYLMSIGVAVTPIHRAPVSVHLGVELSDFDNDEASIRWYAYCNYCEGILIGVRGSGLGHMVFLDNGTVKDGNKEYPIHQCEDNDFYPAVLMVLTCQA